MKRIDLTRDIHFYTNTTIDTLDYSGTGLNSGSKVVFAAYGDVKRELGTEVPLALKELHDFYNGQLVMPGVVALQTKSFTTYESAQKEMDALNEQLQLEVGELSSVTLIVIADDSSFVADKLNNFLWVTFTRTNPSYDIYGIAPFIKHKHWGCNGPVVIDARIKPRHAPPVEKDPIVEKRIDHLFSKGGSLYGVIK